MSDDASEPDRFEPAVRFEFETAFLDQLQGLIPSAPLRLVFLEHGVRRLFLNELAARHRGEEVGILLDGGFGLMITEGALVGAPDLLISFEYEPEDRPTLVTFYRVLRAPVPETAGDEFGPPEP